MRMHFWYKPVQKYSENRYSGMQTEFDDSDRAPLHYICWILLQHKYVSNKQGEYIHEGEFFLAVACSGGHNYSPEEQH